MFVPLEHSYLAALEEDSMLCQYAYDKNVVLTTQSLLLPMMRTIEIILKIDKRDKNVENVIAMVNAFYEKYVGFAASFEEVGDKLSKAQKSYNTAKLRLTTGKDNMCSWIEKIREKSGIKTTKRLETVIEFEGD